MYIFHIRFCIFFPRRGLALNAPPASYQVSQKKRERGGGDTLHMTRALFITYNLNIKASDPKCFRFTRIGRFQPVDETIGS